MTQTFVNVHPYFTYVSADAFAAADVTGANRGTVRQAPSVKMAPLYFYESDLPLQPILRVCRIKGGGTPFNYVCMCHHGVLLRLVRYCYLCTCVCVCVCVRACCYSGVPIKV